MSYKAYNDYELLYLANEYQDMVALDILVRKYEKFIYKKAISFFPYAREIEDYYQEGLLCLLKSIKTFNEKYNKTFMRYFEVILDRHFINMYYKNKRENEKIVMLINEEKVKQSYEEIIEPVQKNLTFDFKSKVEQIVYRLYFLENKNITTISEEICKTKKQIYNAIYRIKQKIQSDLKSK